MLRRGVVGEIPEDRADLAGKPYGHRLLLGEAGGVPVHLGQQEHLAKQLAGGGVTDVVGDLQRRWDVTVRVAAERGR